MNLGFLKKQKRSLPSSVRQAKHSKTLRVGVVGCGQVARHHLRFIAETENAELVGLADVNLESAERLGEMYGIRNLHSSPGG